ncbi:MAG: efflux RND transporter periplasmic adaptor subunit [Ignavibacteriales bacterium]|nr:efflux RND transporter periplasmic adaptor subunit [Ignavibacteriales bacterium]MCF8317014.1 efflux RND transporter periplasmic adaptor subunit [Ignavibacteriales bacterium]MCF8438612.1 efflux RND transporter periplasmic adaptor subunit [Ignavibacteriales bacterium]
MKNPFSELNPAALLKPQTYIEKPLLLAPVILFIVIIIYMLMPSSYEEKEIPTFTVKKGDFLVSITESGEIRAKKSVTISAPRIRGNLKIIYLIPEGTYVKAGEVVAKFDPTEATSRLKDAEAQLEIALSEKEKLIANHTSATAQMESQYKSAELSFELSKLNLEQMKFEAEAKQLEALLQHKKNELSFLQTKQEFESKKIIQQSELNKTHIEIKQKRNELEKAQNDLAEMTLTAPAEGLVVYDINWGNNGRKYSVGDSPWGGAVIINLPDLSEMESVTSVNEVDVSKIKNGLRVTVRLDAFQDSSFNGKVSNVASLGKNKSNESQIKVFEILVDIADKSDLLKPGMTTSNKFIIREIPEVYYVPLEALFEKDGKKIVYILDGSDFIEREVVPGEKGEDNIVIAEGLENGDIVALLDPADVTLEQNSEETETSPAVSGR